MRRMASRSSRMARIHDGTVAGRMTRHMVCKRLSALLRHSHLEMSKWNGAPTQ